MRAIALGAAVGDPGNTLLSRLKDAGFVMPAARCQRGGCGMCRVRLIAGAVEHGPHTTRALPERERARGKALACRAVPITRFVVIAADEHEIRPVAQWVAAYAKGC